MTVGIHRVRWYKMRPPATVDFRSRRTKAPKNKKKKPGISNANGDAWLLFINQFCSRILSLYPAWNFQTLFLEMVYMMAQLF